MKKTMMMMMMMMMICYYRWSDQVGDEKEDTCTGCPKKNATSYISLDFRENRKPVFIIYTLLESYISQLSTMNKSQ